LVRVRSSRDEPRSLEASDGEHAGSDSLAAEARARAVPGVAPRAHKNFRRVGARKLRFATAEELRERTGLVSGDVPPFGEPILPFALYADESVLENERIAFNAGSLTDSIIMQVSDWARISRPVRFLFSVEP
jgi:hypothetical protein